MQGLPGLADWRFTRHGAYALYCTLDPAQGSADRGRSGPGCACTRGLAVTDVSGADLTGARAVIAGGTVAHGSADAIDRSDDRADRSAGGGANQFERPDHHADVSPAASAVNRPEQHGDDHAVTQQRCTVSVGVTVLDRQPRPGAEHHLRHRPRHP